MSVERESIKCMFQKTIRIYLHHGVSQKMEFSLDVQTFPVSIFRIETSM